MDRIKLISTEGGASIAVSGKDKGVLRIASVLADDIRERVDAKRGTVRVVRSDDLNNFSSCNSSTLIVAGIIGECEAFDEFARTSGTSDLCDSIRGKRECYFIKPVSDPSGDNRTTVLIMGSDKLGAEYGLLHISRLIGVSPWHYWADVKNTVVPEVYVDPKELDVITKEPSVELRGFFLNDEWPSLGSWATRTFGRFDENFYMKVFDLLLRLKGNFLWPAMWAEVFAEDGTEYPEASADLATDLGITMGTSHHEPLFRAGEEFSYLMTDSNDKGYGKDWSYYSNRRGIYSFWEDGVKRDKDHKALITIGMRGERDSLLLGENATMKDNVELLKTAITDQKKILRENGLESAPKVLALYKEVEDYYYGDKDTEGLCSWSELDDTMLLLSDDNFGNLRTVPSPSVKDRPAGWGIYYHFDYHGDPISYEWVNSTPITKAWEQLTTAYEYGIRKLWIVNVGDLRPVELPLSYFMDLAYDIEKYGEPNITYQYMRDWSREQFPEAPSDVQDDIASMLDSYTRFNGDRRPEATHPDTFSFTRDREALKELDRCEKLFAEAERVSALVPEISRDAYYGLVEFPAKGSANLRRMMILTGLYNIAREKNAPETDVIADQVLECVELDKELVRRYNEDMADGKWNGMMSSKHVDFKHWNDEDSEYPSPSKIGCPALSGVTPDEAVRAFAESLCAEDPLYYSAIVRRADSYDRTAGTDDGKWVTIDRYGKSGAAVKWWPLCKDYSDPSTAPAIEFDFTTDSYGEYFISAFIAPANNPFKGEGLKFALSVDGGDPVIVDTLPDGYMAGYNSDRNWAVSVLDNGRRLDRKFTLTAGKHTVRFIHLDAGIVLQKIEIGKILPESYYGR